jgi:hypothetical protein
MGIVISGNVPQPNFNCWNEGMKYRDKLYKKLASSKPRYKHGVRIDKTFVELNHVYKEITLLLDQYYSSIKVKQELYYKLVNLGLIKLVK